MSQSIEERYHDAFPKSCRLSETARTIFPGGVTHDLRYMEPFAVYVDRAKGAYKWDVDGHQLLDFWTGHGALLLGHSPQEIVEAVQNQMARGTHYGACHELELAWGKLVQELVPSAEMVRFVGSGTEATLMALRLVRIATGRPKVLKFAGHFHGWQDYLVPCADPPLDNSSVPGIPDEVVKLTVIVPPNDPDAVEEALAKDPQIGCVILEPTGGHWGSVPIRGGFLHALRNITETHKRLLIFDEVITGFRVHPGGAQGHYGIKPDLTTMAKIVAGGLPGGCVGGRADIMEYIDFHPDRPKMKHPGTYNANPLSAAAGIAALKKVATGEPCNKANEMGLLARRKLNELFAARDVNCVAYGDFSGFKILHNYVEDRPVDDDFLPYGGDLHKLERPRDRRFYRTFRQAMLLNGVDTMGPAGLMMAVHTPGDIDRLVEATDKALDWLDAENFI